MSEKQEFTDIEKAVYLLDSFVRSSKSRRAVEAAYGLPPTWGGDQQILSGSVHFLSQPHILEILKSVVARVEVEEPKPEQTDVANVVGSSESGEGKGS
jgi:hypothetical protein